MNVADIQRVLNALQVVTKELGDEVTVRQARALLVIALSGSAGTDAIALQRKLDASQAATSRVLKLLSSDDLELVEFFLDKSDGRLRLARITPKGAAVTTRILHKLF